MTRDAALYNDDREAIRLYREAAESKNPAAPYNLGWMYANGRGVSRMRPRRFAGIRRLPSLASGRHCTNSAAPITGIRDREGCERRG